MHKNFCLVLFVVTILFTQTILAHIEVPIPFDLIIQKNITRAWEASTTFDTPVNITKLQGGGGCRNKDTSGGFWGGVGNIVGSVAGFITAVVVAIGTSGTGILASAGAGTAVGVSVADAFGGDTPCWFSHYTLTFSRNGVPQLTRGFLGGDCKEMWLPYILNDDFTIDVPFIIPNIEVNKIDWASDGVCQGFYKGYLSGQVEGLQTLAQTRIDDKTRTENNYVVPLGEPIQLGKIGEELLPNVIMPSTSPTYPILAENILIKSSTPDVMVWFDSNDAPTRTTNDGNAIVNACADLDHNKKCDYEQAESCITEDGDWHTVPGKEGWCCKLNSPTMCTYDSTYNAFCGKTSGDTPKPQFATFRETGIIHDFTECNPKTQVVFDAFGGMNECKTGTTWKFINIKGHQYYCDSTKPEEYECGGEQPYSDINPLKTGKDITIDGKTNYCLETAIFSTNLDYTTKKSCEEANEEANFVWTGTRCCSEADDKLGTTENNEYYNESAKSTIGACWNSTFIDKGKLVPKYRNNSQDDPAIVVYNGTFAGCLVQDPTILALQNTDPHLAQQNQILPNPATTLTITSDYADKPLTHTCDSPSTPGLFNCVTDLALGVNSIVAQLSNVGWHILDINIVADGTEASPNGFSASKNCLSTTCSFSAAEIRYPPATNYRFEARARPNTDTTLVPPTQLKPLKFLNAQLAGNLAVPYTWAFTTPLTISVSVKNTGSAQWVPGRYVLRFTQTDWKGTVLLVQDWQIPSVMLKVNTGEIVTFTNQVSKPILPPTGSSVYPEVRFDFQMVKDGVLFGPVLFSQQIAVP